MCIHLAPKYLSHSNSINSNPGSLLMCHIAYFAPIGPGMIYTFDDLKYPEKSENVVSVCPYTHKMIISANFFDLPKHISSPNP
jgi:hypothetical protein